MHYFFQYLLKPLATKTTLQNKVSNSQKNRLLTKFKFHLQCLTQLCDNLLCILARLSLSRNVTFACNVPGMRFRLCATFLAYLPRNKSLTLKKNIAIVFISNNLIIKRDK